VVAVVSCVGRPGGRRDRAASDDASQVPAVTVGVQVARDDVLGFDVPRITSFCGRPRVPGPTAHAKIAVMLQPGRIGVELSEEFPLYPEQSTDAIIVRHLVTRCFTP
jgi:hypothetical protein